MLPNITGSFGNSTYSAIWNAGSGSYYNGAFKGSSGRGSSINAGVGGAGSKEITFNASRSSSVYQDNAPVRPLSITTAFLVRY